MQFRLNPAIKYQFDIARYGKRGASKIEDARSLVIRWRSRRKKHEEIDLSAVGSAKDQLSTLRDLLTSITLKEVTRYQFRFDISRLKSKRSKQEFEFYVLSALSDLSDREKELAPSRSAKKAVTLEDEIRYKVTKRGPKNFKSKTQRSSLWVDKYYFELRRGILTVKDNNVDKKTVDLIFASIHTKMRILVKKYGRTLYFVRLRTGFAGRERSLLPSWEKNRDYGGFTVPRTEIKNQAGLDDFMAVLRTIFLESLDTYVGRFVSASFSYEGFSCEVVIDQKKFPKRKKKVIALKTIKKKKRLPKKKGRLR